MAAVNERVKQLLVLGREHYQKREFDKSEENLRQVLEIEDRYADVHDMLGVIAHSRSNYIAAERHFERALSINPAYTEAALNLAVTYNDRGKYDKAREVYTRLKSTQGGATYALDPFARGKIANMHAEIAQAYADCGLVLESVRELEKATALCPHFADLQTRLGSLLRDRNDLVGARARYELAIEHKPNYVAARVQLGVTLFTMGDTSGAEAAWKKSLELENDNSQAKMYLRVLDRQRQSAPAPAS